MKLMKVTSPETLIELISQTGFLPFFQNETEGFSLEECIAREYWFPEQGEGAWEWKGRVIAGADCAYGKFFRGRAGFISREWFPDFANFRRNGYDFDALYDDGLARHTDKQVFEIVEKKGSVLSKDLKKQGDFRKGGNKGFDSIITRLQMQGYILISDFEYQKDKYGSVYGWGVARYETPEYRFGEAFSKQVYQREPEDSLERIKQHLSRIFSAEEAAKIEKMIRKGAVKE
ncbi:MAG: hypothetical protein NC432_03925 [Roseburia sp.]|nr:hypothetical protein [Roseburia sp.]MCM1098495.1 hypothetical protein [Ruminococcus flavefaciens]